MEKLWFKRKRYGYGWTPATYQGWLVVLAYIISILFFAYLAKNYISVFDVVVGFVIPTLMLSMLLIIISWAKGEKPKWQWGEKEDKK